MSGAASGTPVVPRGALPSPERHPELSAGRSSGDARGALPAAARLLALTPGRIAALPRHVAALLRPDAFRHRADDLRLHETHISWVVLAGPYAYKVKKPVSFGFLDFSTLERRAAACADEVRLNRRLCPDVYLGVTHLVERRGTYFVGGPGRAVEPLVFMRRLPDEGMLPHLLAEDLVDRPLVRRIARVLAHFHSGAATGAGVDEHGSLATVRANWEENFAQIAPFVGRTLPAAALGIFTAYVERFLTAHADLLAQRVGQARIREGHGDLHAASICVEGRRLQLFDCIEFNPRIRCADVAADVAFLAMDLDHYGRADLARAFVDAYMRASGDRDLSLLLDFYKCYRACVRGKVMSFRLAEPGLALDAEATITSEARAYFDLAWSYADGLAQPTLVVTMGLPASGKSTLARALAQRLGLLYLSSDVLRKERAGLSPTTRRPEAFGSGLYDPAMTRRTYAALRRRAAHWLRRGQSVVLDATFGRATERAAVRRLAARTGARLVFFVCEASEAVLRARLAGRNTDPSAVSDARMEIWPALRASFAPPVELPGAIFVDTAGPRGDAVQRAMSVLVG